MSACLGLVRLPHLQTNGKFTLGFVFSFLIKKTPNCWITSGEVLEREGKEECVRAELSKTLLLRPLFHKTYWWDYFSIRLSCLSFY